MDKVWGCFEDGFCGFVILCFGWGLRLKTVVSVKEPVFVFGGLGIGFRETIVDSEAQVVVGEIVSRKSQVWLMSQPCVYVGKGSTMCGKPEKRDGGCRHFEVGKSGWMVG